jgi:hypothetical protein
MMGWVFRESSSSEEYLEEDEVFEGTSVRIRDSRNKVAD